MNNSKNLRKMIEYPKEGILSKDLFKDNNLNTSLFCMAKGTEIGEHTATKKATVYVLEGNGFFNFEGEEIEMKEGVLIFMKENAIHSLKAKENTAFVLTLC